MNAFTRQEISSISPPHTRRHWPHPEARPTRVEIEYLPIVDTASGKVVAHQAVNSSFLADSAYDHIKLHIEHGPTGRPLLLTLNVQETVEEELGQSNALLRLLQQQLWSDRELIVHLDHPDDEAWPSMELYKGLQKAGIPIMVDASAAWDLPSLNILIDAHVIRFDATQLPESVEPLLDLAQMMGIQTLLANVSNAFQVEWARQMGFDWLQGRLLR